MANDYIPRPTARFHAWQNNFVTYVNRHLADLALAAGMMGAEICGRVAWASRPQSSDPPPPGSRSVTTATGNFSNSPAAPICAPCGAGAQAFSSRNSNQATVAAHDG